MFKAPLFGLLCMSIRDWYEEMTGEKLREPKTPPVQWCFGLSGVVSVTALGDVVRLDANTATVRR